MHRPRRGRRTSVGRHPRQSSQVGTCGISQKRSTRPSRSTAFVAEAFSASSARATSRLSSQDERPRPPLPTPATPRRAAQKRQPGQAEDRLRTSPQHLLERLEPLGHAAVRRPLQDQSDCLAGYPSVVCGSGESAATIVGGSSPSIALIAKMLLHAFQLGKVVATGLCLRFQGKADTTGIEGQQTRAGPRCHDFTGYGYFGRHAQPIGLKEHRRAVQRRRGGCGEPAPALVAQLRRARPGQGAVGLPQPDRRHRQVEEAGSGVQFVKSASGMITPICLQEG